ncbi:MAG: signal peptidase I [Dehalococcoidia bacterium]
MFPFNFNQARSAVNLFSSRPFVVKGDSMRPALADGQYVQPVSLRLPWNHIRRGDIVVLGHPRENRISIKRVIGLPEEYIQVHAEGVLINECLLSEPYLSNSSGTAKGKASQWYTDADEYFVLGDNRRNSEDSRDFGPVQRDLILKRVWFRYWPVRVFHPEAEPAHGHGDSFGSQAPS